MNMGNTPNGGHHAGIEPFPLTEDEWRYVRDRFEFTSQQAKVVALVLRAACDKKVANELHLGLATVRTHLRKIYEKVRVQDRAELIVRLINVARGKEISGR